MECGLGRLGPTRRDRGQDRRLQLQVREQTCPPPTSKHDKKKVSAWKLPDNASKLGFRHWLDSVDIQLEAVHGFVYPSLAFEKIKRLPTEVTVQVIKEINDEHRKKARLAAGLPLGIEGNIGGEP